MSIHLAGGIRNPKSTSYINCTLQMLLHFHPFLELLESQSNDTENALVKILYKLANKIHSADNSISADALISFFRIDPQLFSDIIPFFKQLIQYLPSEYGSMIKMIDLNEFGTSDFGDSEMIILYVDPSNSQIDIDEFILINDRRYILFSIVQVSGNFNVIRCGHYSILIRDSKGWIQCNDTSVIAIQDESQISSIIHDEKSPIELMAYISDLNLINFNRRGVKFSTTIRSSPISNSDTSTKNSPIIPKKPSFFPPLSKANINRESNKLMIKNNSTGTTTVISSSTSSSDEDVVLVDGDEQSNRSLLCKFFDGKIMKVVKEKEFSISNGSNYRTAAEKVKNEWKNEINDDLQYKFSVDSSFVNNVPDLSTENVSAIFERKNMAMFSNCLINETSNQIYIELIILGTSIHFKALFMDQQNVGDIKSYAETFHNEILHAKKTNIYIFSIFNEKVLRISESLKIKRIKEILQTDELQFGISLDEECPDVLTMINIPIFETLNHFINLTVINHPIGIEDTGQILLDLAKMEINEKPLQIVQFDSQINKFLPIDSNDYLFNIVNLENIRIQKRIGANEITFIPKNNFELQPFSYPLTEDQSLDSLSHRIKEYIGSKNKIVLEYNKETTNSTKIPLNDHQNGIFSFIYIIIIQNIE